MAIEETRIRKPVSINIHCNVAFDIADILSADHVRPNI